MHNLQITVSLANACYTEKYHVYMNNNNAYTEKKKGITCNETESSKRVNDHSKVINALH